MDLSQINAPHQPSAQSSRSSAQCKTLCLVLGIALLPCAALCQVTQSQPDDLKASITRAQAGSLSNADIKIIIKAGASQQVLPALEQQFAAATETAEQGIIANRLVRLADKNNMYWDFLLKQATLAVESDLPDPFHDSQGNLIGNKQLSPDFKAWIEAHHDEASTAGQSRNIDLPEFEAWIEAHHAEVSTAIQSRNIDLPGTVLLLGQTGDRRGIPLLRRALLSHNYQIVVWAAKGLALIQDKDSIPLIKAAIQSAPSEYTLLIAESLVYFDDPLAQSIVDNYMPKGKAKMAREEKARGRGVFGW